MPAGQAALGVDTGGTFTDLVQVDADGAVTVEKAFSTPEAPEDGVIRGLERLAGRARRPLPDLLAGAARFAHGTTISTNALLERRGARVGLITTRGFEDTLAIARGPLGRVGGLPYARAMDFLHTEPPPPLVARALVRGVGGRVTARGEVLAPLDPEDARAAVARLRDAGAESLAVCLLWAFLHPGHEELVRAAAAEAAPGLPVALSSEIAPRMGEYERMTTTVAAAHVGPSTTAYLRALQKRLGALGLARPIRVMSAAGGTIMPENVARQAVSIVNSGPVGGLVAARRVGRALGLDDVITADMGGTSFDVGLIAGGAVERTSTPWLAQGLPVLCRSARIDTLGAGGGSIASADGFRLKVGPESAGADPGPASYGRGGRRATVTDALVVLGVIDPARFFAGRRRLDPGLAAAAVEREVARPLGMGVLDAAAGIVALVNAKMSDLIRKVTVESGNDPRAFALFAFGGACGAHCADLAARLGIRRVVVPYGAPAFSAFGAALADTVYSHAVSAPVGIDDDSAAAAAESARAVLRARAEADLEAGGLAPERAAFRYAVEMRYRGQMNEISVSLPEAPEAAWTPARLRAAFEASYRGCYGAGALREGAALEAVSFQLDAAVETEPPPLARRRASGRAARPASRRRVFVAGLGRVDAAVHDFDGLPAAAEIPGPAVIERDMTTVWVPPGAGAALDAYGNVEIRPAG